MNIYLHPSTVCCNHLSGPVCESVYHALHLSDPETMLRQEYWTIHGVRDQELSRQWIWTKADTRESYFLLIMWFKTRLSSRWTQKHYHVPNISRSVHEHLRNRSPLLDICLENDEKHHEPKNGTIPAAKMPVMFYHTEMLFHKIRVIHWKL